MPKINNITTYPYDGYQNFVELRNKLSGKGQPDVFRLGASDVGTALGLNEWMDATTFFYYACDFTPPQEFRSLDAIRGQNLEPVIFSNYWRLMDPNNPSSDAYVDNFLGEKKVYREAVKSQHIYTNDKYDWLFVTPDYLIVDQPGLVECKSYKSYVLDKYEAGIPQSAVVQCQAQIMATEMQFVELMTLIDATEPRLFRFDQSHAMQEFIDTGCRDFVSRVLEGKRIVYSNLSDDDKELQLLLIAPDDEGSPKYSEFLKEWHRPENAKETRDGSNEELELVIKHQQSKERISKEEVEFLKYDNAIRELFRGNNVGRIDFGEIGHVSYRSKLMFSRGILKKTSDAGLI